MTKTKYRIYIIIVVFIVIISFPLLNKNFKIVKDIDNTENRKMTSMPVFNINLLDPFPTEYEKYYDDNFPLRFLMIKYFNILNMEVFKKSPLPDKVIVGKDDWLFIAGNEIDAYTGKNNFKQEELDAFKQELNYRKKYLDKIGCKFYFLIAPAKANIYPEKLPNTIFRYINQSWGKQLIEYLNKNCEVKPIDVYNILLSHKKNDLLYRKLDNHWNKLCAFYSTNEILNQINKDFHDVTPQSINDYEIIRTEISSGNIIGMLSNVGKYKDYYYQLNPKKGFQAKIVPPVGYPVLPYFPYKSEYEVDYEVKDSNKPRILIISDSFGDNILPFISEEFSRTVRIFDSWEYKLNEEIVANEKPNVMLLVILEPNLKHLLNYQSRLKK